MISMGLVTDQPDFSLLAVKNPELAARWLDFNNTTEGMLLNMYEIENESYIIAADGTYQFTEEILEIEQVWTEQDMSLCLPHKLFMTPIRRFRRLCRRIHAGKQADSIGVEGGLRYPPLPPASNGEAISDHCG